MTTRLPVARPLSARLVAGAAAIDVVLVVVFVLIGRGSHDEGFSLLGSLQTAWPFVAGLAVGWAATRAWRSPLGIRMPGIVVWITTVVIGMLLRFASGQGIAVSFIIVATIVLGVFLLGWRAIAALVRRRGRRNLAG
jgi:hypothetical protein